MKSIRFTRVCCNANSLRRNPEVKRVSLSIKIYLLAFIGGFLASASSLPFLRAWCVRVGLVDDPGHRKIHHTPIPLAGGLAVLTGLLVPLLGSVLLLNLNVLDPNAAHLLNHGWSRRASELLTILFGGLGMGALGWADDKQELSPALKFAGQFLIAALTAAAGIRITLFVPSLAFSYFVTILWILTVTNAFNFMDNMNGLCAGLGVISAAAIAILAARHDQYLVALIAVLVCGALAGFLPFNYPRASAFLGDTGSHLAGYLLAILAILPHFYSAKHPRPLAVLSPLLILAVPLLDLAWVVFIRWRLGQPFYVGDNNHLSHRLVRRGLSKPIAVALIWLLATVLASVAFVIS